MQIRDRVKELRRVPAGQLKPNPKNWRVHPKAQQEALKGILAEVGYADALIAREMPDGSLQLLDGHLRAETTPDMSVPVLVLDLNDAEADMVLATLDPLAGLAGIDPEKLTGLLSEIRTDSAGLRELFDGLRPPVVKEGLTDPDAIPEPPEEPVTKPGDLWILGDHRLLCGDSSKAEDVDRLLAGAPVHLVNCDPPYNVRVEPRSNNAIAAGLSSFGGIGKNATLDVVRHPSKAKATGPMRPRDRALENDWIGDQAFDELLRKWFGNLARVLLPGRSYYIWAGYSNVFNYPRAIEEAGLRFGQILVWVKGHPVLTRKDYMGDHESCYYGWKPGAAHEWLGPNNVSDVWAVKKVNPVAMQHLTEKPVELAARALEYSSRPGENVLDLFGGSGSTLIAAEQTGRKAFLLEIDALYCDVIVKRWEEFTGRSATAQPPK